ncbi:MAG: hypothetical protein ABIN24_06125 [Dyadobacter sp.]
MRAKWFTTSPRMFIFSFNIVTFSTATVIVMNRLLWRMKRCNFSHGGECLCEVVSYN